MNNLRLQMRGTGSRKHRPAYRFSRQNGWNCGCWHSTPEDAAAHVTVKFASSFL